MGSIEEAAFFRFRDALSLAQDEGAFCEAAAHFARDLGFRWFAYFSSSSTFKVVTNYPAGWYERYLDQDYYQVDPIVRLAHNARDPFFWRAADFNDNRKIRMFFAEAAEFGIEDGLVAPLLGPFGRRGAMAYTGAVAGEPLNETVAVLQRAAIYFEAFYEAVRENTKPPVPTLTARELRCLAWIARGKTLPETALLMGVSARTLSHYTATIKEKLNANTLSQAVAIAVQGGAVAIS